MLLKHEKREGFVKFLKIHSFRVAADMHTRRYVHTCMPLVCVRARVSCASKKRQGGKPPTNFGMNIYQSSIRRYNSSQTMLPFSGIFLMIFVGSCLIRQEKWRPRGANWCFQAN